ncbi:LytR/AlgR family response regulator transcription factor [Maribacter polysaccharolyticus]|uniref:LytR/AlgR family response regulator transcription factor n=1 Tax=Maribacter polysaccharolyticus TaxID=3020831 RepID=UPI00237EFC15|nr:response regulator transcription factor [Maribacter polysaccharolyticus]MDE3742044.1 response regulator transcription factor [Maribacter polysaccharolyticus]
MKIKCLIVDDEPLAINVIKNYLDQLDDFEISETFNNAVDALNFLKSNTVDVIFLDINMPVLDGINFIKSLEDPPLLIVTTAYDEFALETYELDVIDYLVKPFEFPRFMKALNKVNRRLKNTNTSLGKAEKRPFIFVKIDKKKMKKIFLDEILTVESLKDYLKINTTTGRYIIHSTLTNFTDLLPSEDFIRIHRSYTVAINKIDAVEGNSVEIEGLRYVIGKSYIDEVKQKILDSSI